MYKKNTQIDNLQLEIARLEDELKKTKNPQQSFTMSLRKDNVQLESSVVKLTTQNSELQAKLKSYNKEKQLMTLNSKTKIGNLEADIRGLEKQLECSEQGWWDLLVQLEMVKNDWDTIRQEMILRVYDLEKQIKNSSREARVLWAKNESHC